MQLYLWPTGPKPTGHPVSPPSDSDYETGQSRENIVLQKMPIAEDEEQVVYMNTSDPQKQNNPAVSQILANQALVELIFEPTTSTIANG